MTFAIALIALLLHVVHLALKFSAPRTKSTLDDKGLVVVEKIEDALGVGDEVTGEVTQ